MDKETMHKINEALKNLYEEFKLTPEEKLRLKLLQAVEEYSKEFDYKI